MADTWAVPNYGVPSAPHASVSFSGIADPVPVGGNHVPVSFSDLKPVSPLDFFGAAGGLFSLGTPVSASQGASKTATPLLHPGQQLVPTAQVNGQAGYVSATPNALQSILSWIGAKNDSADPQVQQASWVQPQPSGMAALMPALMIGGGLVVAWLAFKK